MNQVFILYAVDANDETTIIRVFSNFVSAKSFKDELELSLECRKKFSLSTFDRLFIDTYEVFD